VNAGIDVTTPGAGKGSTRRAKGSVATQRGLGQPKGRPQGHHANGRTLKQCDHGTPEVLAFLAMAQHRAGQHQDARTTLGQLGQTLKRPQGATRTEAQRFLREAEVLLREAAREPKP